MLTVDRSDARRTTMDMTEIRRRTARSAGVPQGVSDRVIEEFLCEALFAVRAPSTATIGRTEPSDLAAAYAPGAMVQTSSARRT
jgi:hypothetical protein